MAPIKTDSNMKQKEELAKMGYAVDTLWSVGDITLPFEDYKKLAILNKALRNEATMSQIWFAINSQLEYEICKNGIWLNIEWKDDQSTMLALFSVEGHSMPDEEVFFEFENIEELKKFISDGGCGYDFKYIEAL